MSNSGEEELLLPVKAVPLKAVTVKRAAAFGSAPVAPRPVAAAAAAPARNVTLGEVVRRRAAPAAAPPAPAAAPPAPAAAPPAPAAAPAAAPPPAPAAAPPTLEVAEVEAEAGKLEVAAADVATEAETTAAAAEVTKLKERLRGTRAEVAGVTAVAKDVTTMAKADFTSALRASIEGKDPVEVKPEIPEDAATQAIVRAIREKLPEKRREQPVEIYRPISAPSFRDFILQTYVQYSPFLTTIMREGRAALDRPKEIDKDACKRRDPNKVENFYYQKFVRDYLSRGTPYRGLLVYHGLGTGKTCTSIAAAEALYWGGQKTIFVLTPATLSNNYRRELSKCGYFPLRTNNFWAFMRLTEGKTPKADLVFAWLTQIMGLPEDLVLRQGGGWVPNPDKPSNWLTLSVAEQTSIREQQSAHLNHRFRFIHYNGVTPSVLAQLAAAGLTEGKSVFDDSVIIIDEVHNLVRTINGTQIGGKPLSQVIDRGIEPREFTWSTPLGRERPGFRYPRGYTLYRLLTNAVGTKVIALSATPMINYAQELAILMNLVGGEQRVVEISLREMARDLATLRRLETWAQKHAEIDYYAVEEAVDRSTILTLTPVPFGFSKVVGADFATRGFVRNVEKQSVVDARERNMDRWAARLVGELEAAGILKAGVAAEAEAAVIAARAKGPGALPDTKRFTLRTFPMLPEDAREFVANFVDRNTLAIKNGNVLKARALGLVSYYKGGSEELMPRTTRNEVVRVEMSEYMFQEYAKMRSEEIESERRKEGPAEEGGEGAKKRKGVTAAEADLYAEATKSLQTGFKSQSRAACNWVFPEDVPRPKMSERERAKLLGLDQDALVAADLAVDVEAPAMVGERLSSDSRPVGTTGAEGEEGPEATTAVLPDEAPVQIVEPPMEAELTAIIGTLMAGLEEKADEYLRDGLAQFSPKYAAMLANIRVSPGPVLVYSQFKTLEGLGIFAAALRASAEKFLPLDIQRGDGGEWEIPAVLMTPEARARPRYILYTGDQELEKRRLLLQLYNADVANLSPRLSAQCAELLAGAPDNRDGRVCRVFMITQSGAEGISLFNTRQVHIMEPYWNNVRLQQVIGRAIRLCSHMNLPWDDRTVEVFTYLSVFSAKQKTEGARAIMVADKAMTTDETIFSIAEKKQRLADGLFEIIQTAAVDCELHQHEHGGAIECFRFGDRGRPMFAYHPNWQKDIQGASAVTTVRK